MVDGYTGFTIARVTVTHATTLPHVLFKHLWHVYFIFTFIKPMPSVLASFSLCYPVSCVPPESSRYTPVDGDYDVTPSHSTQQKPYRRSQPDVESVKVHIHGHLRGQCHTGWVGNAMLYNVSDKVSTINVFLNIIYAALHM